MSYLLRKSLLEPQETWPVIEAAAEERFLDGIALATLREGGREAGAIYLLGYTVEMLIKSAYCRYMNHASGLPIFSILKTDISHGIHKTHGFTTWKGGTVKSGGSPDYHSLEGLTNFLIETRRHRGQQLDAARSGVLTRHILMIEQNREVEMRYSAVRANPQELTDVFESVYWIYENYEWLWRI